MNTSKRIAVFSMTPLFPDFAMGGGQNQLKKVALHLGESGHRLTILSTRREDSTHPFQWHENVQIKPILRFKQPYPEPYFTPLYHIANAMRELGEAIVESDIHYSHDGGLIFPYVYQSKPAVISLRSIIYPETMQSALLFQGDEWILPSEHTRASYHAVVSQFAPAVGDRMHAIHNGFDWDNFRFTPPAAIFEVLPAELVEHPIMLFPHRPELSKGIYEVLEVAHKLVREYGWAELRVLAPRWLDADTEPGNREYYGKLQNAIAALGLSENFVFHDWISEALIAEYYSLADLTMCIGSCVESFGNTPFESMGCGTPAILSRVATYRSLLPDEHVERVDYGDIDAAAACAHAILTERRRTSPATHAYLKSEFSEARMVRRYAEVILKARKRPPLSYQIPRLTDETRYRLAPWCFLSPRSGIFLDFLSEWRQDDLLIELATSRPSGFLADEVDSGELRRWLDDGFVVPDFRRQSHPANPD
jgi:glycosyltransferase involved in cell wall biosynthesis